MEQPEDETNLAFVGIIIAALIITAAFTIAIVWTAEPVPVEEPESFVFEGTVSSISADDYTLVTNQTSNHTIVIPFVDENWTIGDILWIEIVYQDNYTCTYNIEKVEA